MPQSPPSIYSGMTKLGSAALTAASWQCQRCSHANRAEKTRGAAFCAGGGGMGLLRVPPALQSPRRRRDADDHGYPLQREMCQRWRYATMSRQKTCQHRRYVTIRLPTAPSLSCSSPLDLAVTRCSSRWDHATLLTRMMLIMVRPLVRAIVR
jgi:hypothetical protein